MNLFCLPGAVGAGRVRTPGCCGRSCGARPEESGTARAQLSGGLRGGKGSQTGDRQAKAGPALWGGTAARRAAFTGPARTPPAPGAPRRGREGSGEAQRGPGLCLAVPARPGRSRSRSPHGALTGSGRGLPPEGAGRVLPAAVARARRGSGKARPAPGPAPAAAPQRPAQLCCPGQGGGFYV